MKTVKFLFVLSIFALTMSCSTGYHPPKQEDVNLLGEKWYSISPGFFNAKLSFTHPTTAGYTVSYLRDDTLVWDTTVTSILGKSFKFAPGTLRDTAVVVNFFLVYTTDLDLQTTQPSGKPWTIRFVKEE